MQFKAFLLYQCMVMSLFSGVTAYGAAAKDVKIGQEGVQYLKHIILMARNEHGEWEVLLALPRNSTVYTAIALNQKPNEKVNDAYVRAFDEALHGLVLPPQIASESSKNFGLIIIPKVSEYELNQAAQKDAGSPYTYFNWISFNQLIKSDAETFTLGANHISSEFLAVIKSKKNLIPVLEAKLKEKADVLGYKSFSADPQEINQGAEGEKYAPALVRFANMVARQHCRKFVEQLKANNKVHLPEIVLSNQFLAHQMIQESSEQRNAKARIALIKLGITDKDKKFDPNAPSQEFVRPQDISAQEYEELLITLIPIAYGVALKHCDAFMDTILNREHTLITQLMVSYRLLVDEMTAAIKSTSPALLDEYLELLRKDSVIEPH